MQLWSGVLSPFSAKVRVALAEKGLRYETREVPWSRTALWGPKPPEFLSASPRGKVPALVDGPVIVYDSTVICEYLEDRYPHPPLLPIEPAERARCRQLEDEADFAMTEEVTPLVQELFTKTDDTSRNMARVAQAAGALGRRYATLETALAGREYLCGAFTIADVATFMVAGFASTLGSAPGDAHANVRRWFERVRARPCVAREFDAMMAAAAAV
jgi:glutathione S-transferase